LHASFRGAVPVLTIAWLARRARSGAPLSTSVLNAVLLGAALGTVARGTHGRGITIPGYTLERAIEPDGTTRSETQGVGTLTLSGRTTTYEYDDAYRIKKITPPQG
jgi:hypothetical protein